MSLSSVVFTNPSCGAVTVANNTQAMEAIVHQKILNDVLKVISFLLLVSIDGWREQERTLFDSVVEKTSFLFLRQRADAEDCNLNPACPAWLAAIGPYLNRNAVSLLQFSQPVF